MPDLSYLHPQIEVLSASPRHEMLAERLRRIALRPVRAELPDCFDTPQPLLVDLPGITPEQASMLKRAWLKGLAGPLVLLRPHDQGLLRSRDAILLADESDLDGLPARLELRRRQAIRRSEIAIRSAVSESLGEPAHAHAGPNPEGDILHVGDVSARFLPLKRALARNGLNLCSAMSAMTALNHLEADPFLACLVEPTPGGPGARFLEALEARHAPHPPVLLVASGGALPHSGVADEIISGDLPAEVIAATLEELVSLPPLSTREKVTRLSSPTRDPATGLYSMAFLRACLARQFDASDAGDELLSLLHLRLRSARDGDSAARAALPKLADFLVANLRAADLAARADGCSIIVSLRDTGHAGALALVNRLTDALGGENIGAPGTPLPFGGSLSWRVVERRAYHTADTLIQSALAGPYVAASAA